MLSTGGYVAQVALSLLPDGSVTTMSFALDLTRFVGTVKNKVSGETDESEGLDLAIEAIDDVIREIELQMSLIEPQRFATEGTIQEASFGGADSAPNLAMHYSRAHEVTWRTMDGVRKDLEAFQQACRTAKDEIIRADEDASQVMQRTEAAVESLETGSTNHQGRYAHQQAQQNPTSTGDDA